LADRITAKRFSSLIKVSLVSRRRRISRSRPRLIAAKLMKPLSELNRELNLAL
jgi:hypothetical protein